MSERVDFDRSCERSAFLACINDSNDPTTSLTSSVLGDECAVTYSLVECSLLIFSEETIDEKPLKVVKLWSSVGVRQGLFYRNR